MRRLVIALSVMGLFGCKAQLGDKCGKPEDCAVGLQCGAHFKCFDPSKTPNQPVITQPSARISTAHKQQQATPSDDTLRALPKERHAAESALGHDPDAKDKVKPDSEANGSGSAKAGEKCGKPEDCSSGLQCGTNFLCFDPAEAACRESSRCSSEGLCSPKDGDCVALKNGDCKKSNVCIEDGRCGARAGVCVALSDADCRNAPNCRKLARCAMKDGKCVPGSTADCRASALCKLEGTCTLSIEKCVAASTADCTDHSDACSKEGRCDALDGVCVFANPDPK